jgi:hypothetical protein
MLCRPVDAPSPETFTEIENAKKLIDPSEPVHKQLEIHRNTKSTCFHCHRLMDPIGLSLENYDPVGRWRTAYADGKPVVSNGEIDGQSFKGAFGMLNYLKSRPEFGNCFAEKLATFAFAHGLGQQDKCGVWKIAQAVPGAGATPTIREIVGRIVTSPRFLNIRQSSGGASE